MFCSSSLQRGDMFPYLVDRLAVGLGNKHCRDRFADWLKWVLDGRSRKRDDGRGDSFFLRWISGLESLALALPNVRPIVTGEV